MSRSSADVVRAQWAVGRVALASLVPWATFMASAALTDPFVEYRSVDLAGMLRSSLFYMWVIAVFSFFPIAAGRTRGVQVLACLVMSAVSAWAGVVVVAHDDAQAGMAVLVVPPAALALAAVIVAGQALSAVRRRAGL